MIFELESRQKWEFWTVFRGNLGSSTHRAVGSRLCEAGAFLLLAHKPFLHRSVPGAPASKCPLLAHKRATLRSRGLGQGIPAYSLVALR
jgi:hypothetical protein